MGCSWIRWDVVWRTEIGDLQFSYTVFNAFFLFKSFLFTPEGVLLFLLKLENSHVSIQYEGLEEGGNW